MPLVRTSDRIAGARARSEAAFVDAAEALVRDGARYADVSVEQIAARAGFSRASFYKYFSDKRALAIVVGDRFRDELAARVDDWLRGEDSGSLRDALERAADAFEQSRGGVLLVAEAAAYDEEIARFWRALHAHFEELAAQRIVREGGSAGAAGPRAFALVWATQATLVEHLAGGRFTRDEVVDALHALWEPGLQISAG